MAGVVLPLSKAAEYFKIELKASMRDAALRGLRSAAMRGVTTIITRIIPSRTPQPVDRRVYARGWRMEMTMNGADIYNAETHAAFIEYGVRADNVKISGEMIRSLKAWAVRKGYATQREAADFAWGLAKNMQKRGIFHGGLGVLKELIDKHLSDIVREEVLREIGSA